MFLNDHPESQVSGVSNMDPGDEQEAAWLARGAAMGWIVRTQKTGIWAFLCIHM